QKEIHKEELSRKRKIEHAAHLSVDEKTVRASSLHLEALAQTAIVLVCGFFVGGLGFVAVTENIGLSEFASGAQLNVQAIAQEVLHQGSGNTRSSLVAASAESDMQQEA